VEGVSRIFCGRCAHNFVVKICVDDGRKLTVTLNSICSAWTRPPEFETNTHLFTAEFQNKRSPITPPLAINASMSQCISDSTLLTTESLLCVSLGKRKLFIS